MTSLLKEHKFDQWKLRQEWAYANFDTSQPQQSGTDKISVILKPTCNTIHTESLEKNTRLQKKILNIKAASCKVWSINTVIWYMFSVSMMQMKSVAKWSWKNTTDVIVKKKRCWASKSVFMCIFYCLTASAEWNVRNCRAGMCVSPCYANKVFL